MLSIGRVMMARPKLLLLDEPSSGLSPLFTGKIIEALQVLRELGIPMLISEQNTEFTRLADSVMVLDHGRVVFSGSESEAERNEAIHSAYFGVG
jgi:branched-chain amino acid transport system ATP-binding protein